MKKLQSRSKSRNGFVTGSSRAWRSASSKRFDRASPRVFSESTDCWNIASRRAAWSARMRSASLNSGLFGFSGCLCAMTRPRFVSITSVAWQHGQATSSSDLRRAIASPNRRSAIADSLLLVHLLEHAVEPVELELLRHFERRTVGQLRRHAQVAHLHLREIEALAEAGHEVVERRLHAAAGWNRLERRAV